MYLNGEQQALLHNLISQSGLDEFREQILHIAKPSFRIHLKPFSDDSTHLGKSRIGGTPDLPENMDWPQIDSKYLVFLAQLRLAEIPLSQLGQPPSPPLLQTPLFDLSQIKTKPAYTLPSDGMLYFFLEAIEDYEFFVGHRVIYLPETACKSLKSTPRPNKTDYVNCLYGTYFPPYLVEYELEISFPMFTWWRLRDDDYSQETEEQEELRKKWRRIEQAVGVSEPVNRVLGYPYPPEDDIEWKLFEYERALYRDETEFEQESEHWMLLFELHSHEKLNMYWGDSGRLYFMIHATDLQSHNFNRTFAATFSH